MCLEESALDEYLCVTVLSQPGESETDFKSRLSRFWTHMLRNHQDEFEQVYAETVEFEHAGDRVSRKYLIELPIASMLEEQMKAHDIEHEPIDLDDLYSKYEAVPPEWMWIEH
jgi:hypothetical protein